MAESWRPGDFRMCPKCGARVKAPAAACRSCGTSLVAVPVRHAGVVAASWGAVRRAGSSRVARALIALAAIATLGAGLWMRHLFRGAALDTTVAAAPAPVDAPGDGVTDPGWTPPDLPTPTRLPARPPATLVDPAGDVVAGEAPGMVTITPRTLNEPTSQRSFTDQDLARLRARDGSGEAASTAPPPAGEPGAVGKWADRLRDREADLRDAQGTVSSLEQRADDLRRRLASGDPDRQGVEDALSDTMKDLAQAQRALAKAERRRDEAREDARRAGLRVD